MKVIIKDENSINIEGLTYRQYALLVEGLLSHWDKHGDYQVNVDERNLIKEALTINISSHIDLDKERAEIEGTVRKILNKSPLHLLHEDMI